jgi:ribose 5-phosphate isomerase A
MAHDPKRAAALAAVDQVQDGMILGLGTGSTAVLALEALGERVRKGLKIAGIPTSERSAASAREYGIPLTSFAEHARADVTIDGADEVETGSLNIIKGGGGALLREKIVACASTRWLVVADESKLVGVLGSKWAIPVEVVPFGWEVTARSLREIGASAVLRNEAAGPLITDNGNYILDCRFGPLKLDRSLASKIDAVVGVVEHGLFLEMAPEVYVGTSTGVTVLERSGR